MDRLTGEAFSQLALDIADGKTTVEKVALEHSLAEYETETLRAEVIRVISIKSEDSKRIQKIVECHGFPASNKLV
jgi:hypothetical protein